jgi:hypothetical protein
MYAIIKIPWQGRGFSETVKSFVNGGVVPAKRMTANKEYGMFISPWNGRTQEVYGYGF